MTLSELITALPDEPSWNAVVLKLDEAGGIVPISIFEIDADEDERQIKLVTDEFADRPRPHEEAFDLAGFAEALGSLSDGCGDYTLFSASDYVEHGEYEGRLCLPIVGVVSNPDAGAFALLPEPREQWRAIFG